MDRLRAIEHSSQSSSTGVSRKDRLRLVSQKIKMNVGKVEELLKVILLV